jgi:hypothetical protein
MARETGNVTGRSAPSRTRGCDSAQAGGQGLLGARALEEADDGAVRRHSGADDVGRPAWLD